MEQTTAFAAAWHRGSRSVGGAALLAVVLLGLSWVALAVVPDGALIAPWWPPVALSVLALAWAPRSRWTTLTTVVALATAGANLAVDRPLVLAVTLGLLTAGETLLVAWLLVGRRGSPPVPRLTTLEDVWRLVVAALLGAVAVAIGAAVVIPRLDGAPGSATVAGVVIAAHGAALLLLLPFGMRTPPRPTSVGTVEVVGQWVAVLGISTVVFWPGQQLPLTFLPIPLLVWGAVRLGVRTMSAQLVVLGVEVALFTRAGGGAFADHLGVWTISTVGYLEAYLAACAVVALPMAVSVAQRRVALERVEASERILRQGFSESLLGMLMLRRCVPGHPPVVRLDELPGLPAGTAPPVGAEQPDALPHAGGGLDVVELNEVAARMLGRPTRDLHGASFTALLETGDRARLADEVVAMADGRSAGWRGELTLRADGTVRWVDVAITPLSAGGVDRLFSAQLVDVTARRIAEERLTAQALQDPLTGLANRTLLRDRIDLALSTLPTGGTTVVLFCDLDDFKHINDSAGHSVGDGVLMEVATRLRGLLRPDDVAARLGGDEFVVLRPHCLGIERAEDLAGTVLERLAEPVVIGGQAVTLGVSIGIACGEAGARADDLLRDADAAMYAAKQGGKRRAVVFADEHRARALRTVRVENELRRAIEAGQLEVHLQPVVAMATGRVVAAEALLRWRHPERGLLLPGEWLDVAEDSGLMPVIGTWVLERACTLAAGWTGQPAAVHVNVSARQLEVPGFVDVVRGVLARTGLPPERLVLEATETYLDVVSDALVADLASLRAIGVGLAADDFGTGYSPLTRLVDLPVSMVKVDRRFVAAMLTDARSRAVVRALLRLSDSLGLAVVAEGVETEEQAEALRTLGCSAAQGFWWSRAVEPAALDEQLATGFAPTASGAVAAGPAGAPVRPASG